MKNLESFRYEKMMFDALKEECQKVADEIEFAKKNAHGDERMWGYVESFLTALVSLFPKLSEEMSLFTLLKRGAFR